LIVACFWMYELTIRRCGEQESLVVTVAESVDNRREEVGNRALDLRHHVHKDDHVKLWVLETEKEAFQSADVFVSLTGTRFSLESPNSQVSFYWLEHACVVGIFRQEEDAEEAHTNGGSALTDQVRR